MRSCGGAPCQDKDGRIGSEFSLLVFPFRKDSSEWSEPANGPAQLEALSLESASREAFFSRVETFTISFGNPTIL
uniref:Uncharacterized protein n=1 Tax=Malurus cyaneus samueli TaxID=2593467 RepID=A0A8C5T9N2_9PASS